MKNDKIKFLLCLLFFTVLAFITFRCAWPADHVFSASDLNIGRLAFKKNFLPESLTGYFTANQVMGSGGANLTLFNMALAAFPLHLFANSLYGLILVSGSLCMVWFLRLWSRSWLASVFGALIAFWVNSIMLSTGGHAYKMEVLVFSVLSLCLIEKSIRADSVRRGTGFAVFSGLTIGIMMIEQQDVALLAGLFVGAYTIFRLIQLHLKNGLRWVSVLLPILVVGLLLAGNTLLGSYKHNIAGAAPMQQVDGKGDAKWDYITQWSMVPSEWPDLIASGWSGWSSNNPEGPYWGEIGQSAEWETSKKGFRNFKLTSVYFGIIPFLIGLIGLGYAVVFRKSEEGKVILFWSIAGIIGFLLAFGKYSILYKLFFELPLVNNIRAPIKFLDNFQICLAIVGAYGLDQLIAQGKSGKGLKLGWIGSLVCGGVSLLAGFGVLLAAASRKAEFVQMGYERFSDIMVQNMANGWFHAAILSLVCSGLLFLLSKGIGNSKWIVSAFVVVLAVDSLILTSHYFKADDIASLKRGNGLTNYLKEHQGDERTYFIDQTGIYNQWLASDGPYNGLNLFNIWQMPRMPVIYKEYLGKVGRNQVRLWELSSIKYIAAPATILQQLQQNPELGQRFKPVLNYQVPTAQGMRKDVLLEFAGSIPRYALYKNWDVVPVEEHCDKLILPSHNPQTNILIDSDTGLTKASGAAPFIALEGKTTKRSARIEVQTDVPAVLRFSQRYQNNWSVFVNGKKAPLLRVDFVAMGVEVPPGNNIVEFRCPRNTPKVIFIASVFIVSIIGGSVLTRKSKSGSTEK